MSSLSGVAPGADREPAGIADLHGVGATGDGGRGIADAGMEAVEAATAAPAPTRARSVDFGGLTLMQQLEERLKQRTGGGDAPATPSAPAPQSAPAAGEGIDWTEAVRDLQEQAKKGPGGGAPGTIGDFPRAPVGGAPAGPSAPAGEGIDWTEAVRDLQERNRKGPGGGAPGTIGDFPRAPLGGSGPARGEPTSDGIGLSNVFQRALDVARGRTQVDTAVASSAVSAPVSSFAQASVAAPGSTRYPVLTDQVIQVEIDLAKTASGSDLAAHWRQILGMGDQGPGVAAEGLRLMAAKDPAAAVAVLASLHAFHAGGLIDRRDMQAFVDEICRLEGPGADAIKQRAAALFAGTAHGSQLKLAVENPKAARVIGEYERDPAAAAKHLAELSRDDPAAFRTAMREIYDRRLKDGIGSDMADINFLEALGRYQGPGAVTAKFEMATLLYNRGRASANDTDAEPFMSFSAEMMADPAVAKAMYRERPEQFEKMLEAYMGVRPELGAAVLESSVTILAEEVAAAAQRGDEAALTRAANRLGRMVGIACDALDKAEAGRDEIVKLGQMILGKVAGYIEDKIPGSGIAKDLGKAVLAKAQSFGDEAIEKKWGKGKVVEEFRDRLLRLAATTYGNATDPQGTARRDRESPEYETWYSGYERFEEQVTEGFNTTRDGDDVERLPR